MQGSLKRFNTGIINSLYYNIQNKFCISRVQSLVIYTKRFLGIGFTIRCNACCSTVFSSLNGFFVLSEFAIVKVRRTKLEEMAKHGKPNASLALKCQLLIPT